MSPGSCAASSRWPLKGPAGLVAGLAGALFQACPISSSQAKRRALKDSPSRRLTNATFIHNRLYTDLTAAIMVLEPRLVLRGPSS
jgi:hypothetical protein